VRAQHRLRVAAGELRAARAASAARALCSCAADARRTTAAAQWPEMCNKPLAAVDPEMARNRGALACAHTCGA
jgi:hypothetical protein